MSLLPRLRSIACALTGFLLLAAVAAYSSSAQSPQLGSLSTVNLCVRKAGPEKGAVRFVQKRSYCKAGELRVRVLGDGSTQGALGLGGGGTTPVAASKSSALGGYVRIEATSPVAAGTPETASATVTCPADRRVLGGGHRVDAGNPAVGNNPAEVVVVESRATSDATWSVTAFADDADDVGSWSVSAYAICSHVAA